MTLMASNGLRIVGTVRRGLADLAGIQPGGVLMSVSGAIAADMDIFDLREVLTGVSGQQLEIVLLRDGAKFVCELEVQDRSQQPAGQHAWI